MGELYVKFDGGWRPVERLRGQNGDFNKSIVKVNLCQYECDLSASVGQCSRFWSSVYRNN